MGSFCDLHTHSHYSDGTLAPAKIIAQADRLGLSAVALTDHNTVAGLPEFLAAGRSSPVRAIAGVEISTGYQGQELHIVGLYLQEDRFEEITGYLREIRRRKEESNRRLIAALNQAGYLLDYDEILRSRTEGNVNRAVIASAMLEKGYIASRDEAFRGVLSSRKGLYRPPRRLCAFEAIAFLRSVGAVPVLAHPFLNLTENQLREFLPEAKQAGLAAMETRYAAFTPEQTALAEKIAREFSLKESGGSDFHGDVKPEIRLGIGKGDLAVPAAFADDLNPLSAFPKE